MPRYNPALIEPKWQEYWWRNKTFRTSESPRDPAKKVYVLDMFPYPSGDGLHVGHPEGYTATDIVCRVARMRGQDVLHPMGFDAFGLPAEEHAIATNTPPRVQTQKNIDTFRRQLRMLGFSYDWDRELATTDIGYFRWTQWIFLVLYDTWFDSDLQRGRPIAELAIPPAIEALGVQAVEAYRDQHRLAYQADALVNWCPGLGTVLANEEVIDGRSERGGHPVHRIPLRQWMLRITAYGERLLEGLDQLDWPEGIKKRQRDWIGRSTGAEVDFYLGSEASFPAWRQSRHQAGFPREASSDCLRVYTTRPDTLFGATYMVLAPEHPLVPQLTTDAERVAVERYRQQAGAKSDLERTELTKSKSGVFTGAFAINPVNGSRIPIWIADYVLISYGTGAIMAVPAHDTRDFEFAKQFGLPIVGVVDPGESVPDRESVMQGLAVFPGEGTACNSGPYDRLPTGKFKQSITQDLSAQGLGRAAVNYKLRDWLFSRQRFWGEPIPVLHEIDEQGKPTGVVRPLAPEDLPLDLPHLDDYKPHGRPEPPLAKAPADWLYVTDRAGRKYRRETNTMPQWAGSCWYYLRFIDPHNEVQLVDPAKEAAWMPVDLYVGGAEHAVLHLLYSRFWHQVLYDRGHIRSREPFQRLINQGMILGETEFTGYRDKSGNWVSSTDVTTSPEGNAVTVAEGRPVTAVRVESDAITKREDVFVLRDHPDIRIESRAHKMSKSRKNVVNPDEVVRDYGADSLRLYEMYMGPLEATKPWSMAGVNGIRKFLDRVWRLMIDEGADGMQLHVAVKDEPVVGEFRHQLHKTIKAVTEDIDRLEFNTAIARLIEFVNFATKEGIRPRGAMETLVLLLSPFAPHLCEELWQALGHVQTLAYEGWPHFEDEWARESTLEIPVQINGKLRAKISVAPDATREAILQLAQQEPRVLESLGGGILQRTVYVPGRLVNFVVKLTGQG